MTNFILSLTLIFSSMAAFSQEKDLSKVPFRIVVRAAQSADNANTGLTDEQRGYLEHFLSVDRHKGSIFRPQFNVKTVIYKNAIANQRSLNIACIDNSGGESSYDVLKAREHLIYLMTKNQMPWDDNKIINSIIPEDGFCDELNSKKIIPSELVSPR